MTERPLDRLSAFSRFEDRTTSAFPLSLPGGHPREDRILVAEGDDIWSCAARCPHKGISLAKAGRPGPTPRTLVCAVHECEFSFEELDGREVRVDEAGWVMENLDD